MSMVVVYTVRDERDRAIRRSEAGPLQCAGRWSIAEWEVRTIREVSG